MIDMLRKEEFRLVTLTLENCIIRKCFNLKIYVISLEISG